MLPAAGVPGCENITLWGRRFRLLSCTFVIIDGNRDLLKLTSGRLGDPRPVGRNTFFTRLNDEETLMRQTSLIVISLLALLAVLAGPAFPQGAGSATITGTLTDPSGATVPGASVTIRNSNNAIERKIESNEAGVYSAPFLPPGHYEVRAGKSGFGTVVRKELTR